MITQTSTVEMGAATYEFSAEVILDGKEVKSIILLEPVIRSVVNRPGWGIPLSLEEFIESYGRYEGLTEDEVVLDLLETIYTDYIEEQEWLYSGQAIS